MDVQIKEDICTACGSKNPNACVHEFTGIRTGAYADYMYDHINYPQAPTDYSDPGSRGYYSYNQCNMLAAEYANVMGCGSASYYSNYPLVPQSQRLYSESSRGSSPYRDASENGSRVGSMRSESGKGSSVSESVTGTGSSSERSWTSSYTSGTGSSRSTTGSSRMSSRSTASSAYSPIDNGPNGVIAQDAFWHEAALNAGIVHAGPNGPANQSIVDQLEDGGLAQEIEWVENPIAIRQESVELNQGAVDPDVEMSENSETVRAVGNSSSVSQATVSNINSDVSFSESRDIIPSDGTDEDNLGAENITTASLSSNKVNDSLTVASSETVSVCNSTTAQTDKKEPISNEENVKQHLNTEKIEECANKVLLDKEAEDGNRVVDGDNFSCAIGSVTKDGHADVKLGDEKKESGADSAITTETNVETNGDVDEHTGDKCQTNKDDDTSDKKDNGESGAEPN